MSLWIACIPTLVTVILFYYGLFQFSKSLYKKNPIWAVSFAVFMSPFVYVLAQVESLVELMWVLLLTPFYGVAVLMILFTSWMIRYYSIAYGILAVLHYLFLRKPANYRLPEDHLSYELFWDQRRKARVRAMTIETRLKRRSGEGKKYLIKRVKKYWNFVFVIFLAAAMAATLVGNAGDNVRDPTYQEALQFIAIDQTDQNRYTEESHTCAKFAADFKNNAFEAGYNCGYVLVYFPDGASHALNCFNTTDHGLVFIEPQLDGVVTLTIGQPYWDRTKYEPPDYDDTVIGYRINW